MLDKEKKMFEKRKKIQFILFKQTEVTFGLQIHYFK